MRTERLLLYSGSRRHRRPSLEGANGAGTHLGGFGDAQVGVNVQGLLPVLDGTLIPVDRLAADRPFYSGKHRKHGMNLQVIASQQGEISLVSGALPGAVHDLTAARIWGILRRLAAAGLIVLADKGR